MYNLTSLASAETPTSLLRWGNIQTGGLLAIGFSLILFFAILIGLLRKGYRFVDSMAAALFSTTIVSGFATFFGFIPPEIFLRYLVATGLIVFVLWLIPEQ